jgi:hypothetical protein
MRCVSYQRSPFRSFPFPVAYTVFVSYSHSDLATVQELRRLFEQSQIKVFIAEYSVPPGAKLAAEIEVAIAACDIFVLLWSSNSKASEWVGQEIGIAKARGKQVLPVVLEEGLQLPGFIKDLKYLSAHKSPEKALTWLRTNVFEKAKAKDQQQGLVWMGLGAGLLWLLGSKDA